MNKGLLRIESWLDEWLEEWLDEWLVGYSAVGMTKLLREEVKRKKFAVKIPFEDNSIIGHSILIIFNVFFFFGRKNGTNLSLWA